MELYVVHRMNALPCAPQGSENASSLAPVSQICLQGLQAHDLDCQHDIVHILLCTCTANRLSTYPATKAEAAVPFLQPLCLPQTPVCRPV